ncbi:tetratricopeptide repeat protein [Actinomadura rupiterrae]|uniref:tetratricopeptide repeat protein n=1 Tax=Actinomadura rupiterrae TaxID=559627 RepID=UPI0020A49D5B|nr:tetratricopeptide repeat protein [Actinomadura rupiterrae]MCP2337563.1 tetratricopeptide (TPR) repeat protein [Actinomadura rupiterrae]
MVDSNPHNIASADLATTIVQISTIQGHLNLGAPAGIPAMPRQIPPVAPLVDRNDIRAIMTRHLREVRSLLVLTGPAGIGKTLLASHILAGTGGGQLYADLAWSTSSLLGIRSGWLRALGVHRDLVPDDDAENRALWHTVTAQRAVAVLIDGASSAEQVTALRPSTAGATIVTSRRPLLDLTGAGARRFDLPPLSLADAIELLRDALTRAGQPPQPEDGTMLTEMAKACGGLPLALHLTAANTASTTPDNRPPNVLECPVSRAYDSLSGPLARAWRLLTLIPASDFDTEAAATLLDTSPTQARDLLAALHTARLIQATRQDGPTPIRWQIPDALKPAAAEARDQDEPIDQQEQALDRLLDWIRPAAQWAAACATPYRSTSQHVLAANRSSPDRPELTTPAALDWLADQHDLITGCLQTAEDRGAFHLVIALATTGWPLALHHLIDPQRWFTGDQAALQAAELLDDTEAAARALDRLGVWARRTGNHNRAIDYLTRAADQWALLGNPFRQAESRRRIGHVHLAQGHIEEALEMFEQARSAFEQIHSDQGKRSLGLTLIDLATAHLAADHPSHLAPYQDTHTQHAIAAAERGYELILAHAPLDQTSQARALVARGEASARLDHDDALDSLRRALGLAEQAGAVSVRIKAMSALAETLLRLGEEDTAAAIMIERHMLATGLRT